MTAAFLCFAGAAQAQSANDPLARQVTINVRDVSLRDALDRVALLAGIRISYSGDNLPLDRRVAVADTASPVADVLRALLRGFPVEPVVVASDHVVLTPRRFATDSVSGSIAVLDRVVVTGSVLGAPERPLAIALDVIPGRDIERRDQSSLSQVFDGSVPGVWMWEQSPSSMLARYGSIRGASSFGVSSPKVYVDGIEVANPLLFTQLTPELIERVEVIRGPQGAALYGSEAISGVVNIVSRHEGTGADGVNVKLRSQGGYAQAYLSGAVPVQDHAVSLRVGSNLKSAGLTVGGSTTGEYIPDAYSRELRTIGDARLILARTTLSATARFYDKHAGVPLNPLLPANRKFGADSNPQTLRMYSVGSTVMHMPSQQWTYAFTGGIDGYSLTNISTEGSPIAAFVDSALRAAGGSAVRGTLRASAVTRVGTQDRLESTFTFAAEQSLLRERSLAELPSRSSSGPGPAAPRPIEIDWTSTTGFTSQANIAIRDAVFLTAGLRNESIGLMNGDAQSATLPMVGAALVRDAAGVTSKLRVAYGRGIRAARATRQAPPVDQKGRVFNPNLSPEEQSGIEAGVDMWLGRRLGVHVTRFDQLAFGLVQNVTLADTAPNGNVFYLHQLQNVGEITNRGWETEADLSLGVLRVAGAATFVDSRVRKLATGYTGDMRVGDRMLGVPSRTLSGTASFALRGFMSSTTVSRAYDWVNYDRLGIADCVITRCSEDKNFAGQGLRRWWTTYEGNTRLRSAASYDLPRGFTLTATGENLLNYQFGEPDSITIVPGRTITLGLKARF